MPWVRVKREASIDAARLLASALRFPRINSPSESHEQARLKRTKRRRAGRSLPVPNQSLASTCPEALGTSALIVTATGRLSVPLQDKPIATHLASAATGVCQLFRDAINGKFDDPIDAWLRHGEAVMMNTAHSSCGAPGVLRPLAVLFRRHQVAS